MNGINFRSSQGAWVVFSLLFIYLFTHLFFVHGYLIAVTRRALREEIHATNLKIH